MLGETKSWLLIGGVAAPSKTEEDDFVGSGAGRKRLPIPLDTTPGCIPKNGVSKLIVPSIR